MLRVDVLPGPDASSAADLLREHDDLVDVTLTDRPGRAALVLGDDEELADLPAGTPGLWERVGPFARRLARLERPPLSPAVLEPHDPALLVAARRLLRRVSRAFAEEGVDDGAWTYDHIGSTSVSGITAKRIVDLQIGMTTLPEAGSPVDDALLALGYMPARGPRPDSPGVFRDIELEPDIAPGDSYRKRLYFRPDPGLTSILHVRVVGVPWWSYTVLFRDWLRVEPDARTAYQAMKTEAAAEHADDPDYDAYTWAKAPFFSRTRQQWEQAGRGGPYRVRRAI